MVQHAQLCKSIIQYVLQVQVNYKQSRTYALTPSRKKLGKCVGRGSRHAIAAGKIKESDATF